MHQSSDAAAPRKGTNYDTFTWPPVALAKAGRTRNRERPMQPVPGAGTTATLASALGLPYPTPVDHPIKFGCVRTELLDLDR